MKNFKKLSRQELKNVFGGVDTGLSIDPGKEGGGSGTCGGSCIIYIQDYKGVWQPNQGSCGFVLGNTNAGTGYPQGSCQCNIGTGQTYQLQSNGGVSRCEK